MVARQLTPADIAAIDPAYWAVLWKVQLQAGPFTFVGHEYERAPMSSTSRRRCYMKAAQVGITEVEVLRTLHGLIHGRYPQGVLYVFPTTDNVREFSKSRFAPLISANREAIGKYVKSGGKGTDSADLKKVGASFLYFHGARMTQSVGLAGEDRDSVQLRSKPVDRLVFEEVDLMDPEVIAKARSRLGHSIVKEEVYLSNPSIPGYGIDALFSTSDRRHWLKRCGCGAWTCAEREFPSCVKLRPDRTGYIGCTKCGADVGPTSSCKGEWVPEVTDGAELEGWRLSQLMSPFVDPAEILREFADPPQGNLADVYRLRLGMPYVAAEDRLSAQAVYVCCGPDLMAESSRGPCAMGVDIGKTKHVVIGTRRGPESYRIVKVARVGTFGEVHDLAARYSVKSAVVDARPYEDEARSFQRAEPYRVHLCEYTESPLPAGFNDSTGLVKVNRTEVFDLTHRLILGTAFVLPRRCSELDEFARQCCGAAKVLETNRRAQGSVYRYRVVSGAGDHYRNALNYFCLAAGIGRLAAERTGFRPESPVAEYEYVVI